jgi:aspartate kinase
VARISILGVADVPGVLAQIFGALAAAGIDVDMIVQSGVQNSKADFSFTLSLTDRSRAMDVIAGIQSVIPYDEATYEENLVKVSIVGAGMVSNPGVAARMFEAISKLGVSIKMVSTSEIKVSCVIAAEPVQDVVRALHTAYGLDTADSVFVGGPQDRR